MKVFELALAVVGAENHAQPSIEKFVRVKCGETRINAMRIEIVRSLGDQHQLPLFYRRGIDGANVGNARQPPLGQIRRRTLVHIDRIDEIRGENREIEGPGPRGCRQFTAIEIHLSEFGIKTADTDELALPGAALNLHAGDPLQRFG